MIDNRSLHRCGNVGLACHHGKPDRERSGNLRTRRRNRRNIGPLASSSVLMCDGRRNGQGGGRIQLPARDPGWKCPGPPLEVVAVAQGKRRRNEAAGSGYIRPTVPLPMTGKPLLRCVRRYPAPVAISARHALPRDGRSVSAPPSTNGHNRRDQIVTKHRPMHANDNRRTKATE